MKKSKTTLTKSKSGSKQPRQSPSPSPSRLIDGRIKELSESKDGDWRGGVLARIRKIIRQAVPDVVEEWKWRGVPVWSHNGILCTGETYKNVVKMTFAKGAALADPAGLFNASLEGNTRRAIDFHEGDPIDEKALTTLIRATVEMNANSNKARRHEVTPAREARSEGKKGKGSKVKLLAGGNPQIAKGDGDAPVQAYLVAIPGWKRDVGQRLDALIVRTVPNVRKAVKW